MFKINVQKHQPYDVANVRCIILSITPDGYGIPLAQ